jgi:hypothetical protein
MRVSTTIRKARETWDTIPPGRFRVRTHVKAGGLCGSYCPNHNRRLLGR